MKLALGFAVVAVLTGAAFYFGVSTSAGGNDATAAEAAVVAYHQATPSAAEFAHDLAGAANQYGAEHAKGRRLTHTQCVQATRGHYMCSYAVVHANGTSECHLIQATWTPDATSSFTITLSGRVARCSSLREALDSMG